MPPFYKGGTIYRRVVLENHVNTTVQLDRKVVGKAAYEYIKEYQHMTGT